jgi:hypothetical protein
MKVTCLRALHLIPVILMGRGKAWCKLQYIGMHVTRDLALIMVFILMQTSVYLERRGCAHRAAGLIHVHCDVEVCENADHHCHSNLHLGYSIQHSRAGKKFILNLTFCSTVLC